jgi:hypothetical protein
MKLVYLFFVASLIMYEYNERGTVRHKTMSKFLSLTINIKHTQRNYLYDYLKKYINHEKDYAISCETSDTHEHIHAGFHTKDKINTIRVYLLKKFSKIHFDFKDKKQSKKGGNHFLIIKEHDDADYFLGYIYKELKYNNMKTNINENHLKIKQEYYLKEKSIKKAAYTKQKINKMIDYLITEYENNKEKFTEPIITHRQNEIAAFLVNKMITKKVIERRGLNPHREKDILRLALAIILPQYKKDYEQELCNYVCRYLEDEDLRERRNQR